MKLQQTSLNSEFSETIRNWAKEVRDNDRRALFHIYVPYDQGSAREDLKKAREIIRNEASGIPVVGCSATGEILNGQMSDSDIVVTLYIFEDPGTRVDAIPFYGKETEAEVIKVLEYAKSIPNLKGIEVLTAAPYQRLESAGKIIDVLPEDVEIFGGVAVGDDKHLPYVFANDEECCFDGSAVVFYSGANLHMQTYRMFGWKPIGYPLTVTRSEGAVIYELDGKPAYDVYKHYLQLDKEDNFFYDALEFPFEVNVEEATYIRHAKSVNEDGSIVMSTNVPQGSSVRITYGDPRSIIGSTKETGLQAIDFSPEVVNIINCMGRKLFWSGRENVEIGEISKYLHTMGFSALGEIMRYKGTTFLNNLSIVAVAMKEGDIGNKINLDFDKIVQTSSMPMTARLAVFINTITEELMEKNRQLNEMLYKASHDALTGLLNRGAIERAIYETEGGFHLIMFDVDNFKMINDTYGHAEGDSILKLIAGYLSENIEVLKGVEVGRWGGEEFMVLLTGYSVSEAGNIAETIRNQVKELSKDHIRVTISAGVTQHLEDDTVQATINRVDALLYKAKNLGKDCVQTD